jgi:hypothetical protein
MWFKRAASIDFSPPGRVVDGSEQFLMLRSTHVCAVAAAAGHAPHHRTNT